MKWYNWKGNTAQKLRFPIKYKTFLEITISDNITQAISLHKKWSFLSEISLFHMSKSKDTVFLWKKVNSSHALKKLFHDGGSYHIETSPLICSAYQWTGFFMIWTSVMNKLKKVIGVRPSTKKPEYFFSLFFKEKLFTI